MKSERLTFTAHARLKDIVGRGLINDDNVAIIELIKNAKDANSKSVDIYFTNAAEVGVSSQLIIQDFGTGMSLDDIKNKWLNIAYSEKKNTSQDDGSAYAGNKGIGRFSCDRLGQTLSLYTRTKGNELLCLDVDWTKFEVDDQKTNIGKIGTTLRVVKDSEFSDDTGLKRFSKGTVLVMRELRTDWPKDKIANLRKELERFVIDPKQNFSIVLTAEDFPYDEKLNGEVENRIFDELDFRTTSIVAKIPSDGKTITISLRHDGDELFNLTETNEYTHLKDLKITIFYLNQPAKAYFKKRTGYASVDFGSIFLFLNGFRVLPYGEASDDWLGLERRKGQGTRRYLSTRDVIGHIEINDSEDTFHAVSSREGLVRNEAFNELAAERDTIRSTIDGAKIYGLFHKVFRKLERFVVEGLDWNRIANKKLSDEEIIKLGDKLEYKTEGQKIYEALVPTINIRSSKSTLRELKINFPHIVELAREEAAAYDGFVEELQSKFEGTSAAKLSPSEKRDISRFVAKQIKAIEAKEESIRQLEEAADELEREKEEAERLLQMEREEAERQLDKERKLRLFAETESSADKETLLAMHHQIGLIAGKLFKSFDRTIRLYREDENSFTKYKLFQKIESAVFEVDMVRKVSKFASKAEFSIKTNNINKDLIRFIKEYVETIHGLKIDFGFKIDFVNEKNIELVRYFRPIELTMLIDNLLDNAGKASAKRITITATRRGKRTTVLFTDNGRGLPAKYKAAELFQKGISTTDGSGIGLNHVERIVAQLKGRISIENNEGKGATVRLVFEEQ